MFRRMALTVCLVGSCVWCMALVTRADSSQPASGGGEFKPVADVDALMFGQVTFFKKIGQELKKPLTKGTAHEIEEAAQVLAELANVNRFNNSKSDYKNWATQLRDTALEMAEEAEKKDAADTDRLKKLFSSMKATCAACHDVYQ